MTDNLYPYDMPAGVHPLGWTLYGFGLEPDQVEALAVHLFDDLGCRLNVPAEPKTWQVGFAVDWPLDPGERLVFSVGDEVDIAIPDGHLYGCSITSGALPPGIRLEKSAGRIVGTLTQVGVFNVTVTLFPAVKYDPLGGPGGPASAGRWIPINAKRFIPDSVPAPQNLEDLSAEELEEFIVAARTAQNAQLLRRAEAGGL